MEQFFQVGIITSAHGVHGEVKVYPTTDDVKRFRRLKEVIIRKTPSQEASGNHPAPQITSKASGISGSGNDSRQKTAAEETLEIESVKFFKQFVILKFKGIDTMEAAEKYRKCSLIVPRSKAVRLSRDEYFIADLIGLEVRDEDGTEIGILNDVIETGANDVYAIRLHDGREFLLPAIRQCVLEVDVENGFIRIHILEGLLDEA
ncbi:MAG TPA: 16S rRNA processing protein RimM [Lachnospiraceae bacterium]|nr:16S rRNA processing protein RimM [Lachnospiraceae bacterium]